jgi:thiopeptide-type bacteriocin biosynthesis protein
MIQRNFILGESWLYYKIYSAPRTSDIFLAEVVKPLTEELLQSKLIDQWFFIRYADPKHHLRLRFHFSDTKNIGAVIAKLQPLLSQYLDDFLIWDVQTATYKREVERYGENTMQPSEALFHHDSKMIVDFLHLIQEVEDDTIRWLFALRAIDSFLDSFQCDDENKLNLLDHLQESFRAEFNVSKDLAKQLNDKFRAERQRITAFMELDIQGNHEYAAFFSLLINKQAKDAPYIEQIAALHRKGALQVQLPNLLSSYIHMLMNRLFKSKNRLHEMVCYDFLFRHYKSKVARRKSASSKKNEKKAP